LLLKGFVINRAHWSRDGKQLFLSASQPGHASRIYRLGLEGGTPEPLSPEGVTMPVTGVSPDGKYLPGVEISSNRTLFFPTAGGPGEALPGLQPNERIANWTADGAGIFAFEQGQDIASPVKIFRI
jgi:Tol biopolymer transport system component